MRDKRAAGGVRLSVVVPAYNCAAYLDECLRSVLDQLPDDCELVVADDGSDDGTAALLAGYGGTRENLRVLFCEHRGASGARNAGMDAAAGEYLSFLDCDDCLQPGFLEKCLPMLESRADLYIFGIERIVPGAAPERWTVADRAYPDVSAFADEYVRVRALMVYSNCNKFYRRSVARRLGLRFDEGVAFGEDRLFNYGFLAGCGRIETSSELMLRYIRRGPGSMSARHIPRFFENALALHRAKTHCFLSLSTGTSEEERRSFAARDLAAEIWQTLDRFAVHPGEEAENMPAVNAMVFGLCPALAEELREGGVADPAAWYRTEDGRRIVLERLRETDGLL